MHPEAAKVVCKNLYVDDLLTGTDVLGTDSLEDGKEIATNLVSLTNLAGFMLRAELLSTIPAELPWRTLHL